MLIEKTINIYVLEPFGQKLICIKNHRIIMLPLIIVTSIEEGKKQWFPLPSKMCKKHDLIRVN